MFDNIVESGQHTFLFIFFFWNFFVRQLSSSCLIISTQLKKTNIYFSNVFNAITKTPRSHGASRKYRGTAFRYERRLIISRSLLVHDSISVERVVTLAAGRWKIWERRAGIQVKKPKTREQCPTRDDDDDDTSLSNGLRQRFPNENDSKKETSYKIKSKPGRKDRCARIIKRGVWENVESVASWKTTKTHRTSSAYCPCLRPFSVYTLLTYSFLLVFFFSILTSFDYSYSSSSWASWSFDAVGSATTRDVRTFK